MSCACQRNYVQPMPRPTPVPPPNYGGCCVHPHIGQSPAFFTRSCAPCGPVLFIPNQPPVPDFSCCSFPAPQKGPWEYVPSIQYPNPCGRCGGPWRPPMPHHAYGPYMPFYMAYPPNGCIPFRCYGR